MTDPEHTPPEQPRRQPRVQEALGSRLSRDTGAYVIGAVITFFLALVSIAVVTRFLSPAEFGELALLLVFAAFLTVFYNVGLLQGTFSWVFGSSGEEEVDDTGEEAGAGTKRRALGTGLIMTFVIAALGTAVVAAIAPWLADSMLGDSGDSDLIMVAAASGAAGAMWRMVSNITRMERRPRSYVILNSVRPILVVGAVIPLVAAGGGVGGAILGTAIGSLLSVLVGLVATRHSYALVVDRGDLRMIARRGLIYVPIIISIWIAQNVDIYTLSWFAPEDEVGLYRLANRVGAFVDYFTAAVFMAWQPLIGTPTFAAAIAERGREALGGRLLTFFAIAGVTLILAMTVTADALVRIAPPAYADAAPLIPLMGAAFLSYGMFVAVYRLSSFPRKIWAYTGAAMASAAVFLLSALFIVPWLGAYGAALSVVIGFLSGTAALTFLSQRGPSPLEIEYGRIAAVLALAGGGVAAARGLGPLAGSLQPLVELAAFAAFLIALVALRVVTRDDLGAIRRVLGGALPKRTHDRALEAQVRELRPAAQFALEGVVVRRWSVSHLADHLGGEVEDTEMRLVWMLRRIDGPTDRTEHDQRIGAYLFSDEPVAELDALAGALMAEGVDPHDLHALETTLEGLRRLPPDAWSESRDPREEQAE